MLNTQLSKAARTAALTTGLCAEFNGGTMEYRTGAQPATADDAVTGDLLATPTFAATAFASVVDGVATAGTITAEPNAPLTGVAGYVVCRDDAGAVLMMGSIGVSAAPTFEQFNVTVGTTTVNAGNIVTCESFVLTIPAAGA